MGTETVSSRYRGIETWDDRDVMEALLEAQLSGVAAVKAALPALAGAAAAAAARLRAGKRLAYAGAGTSARLAVQDGTELTPTYGWPRERLVFLVAGGSEALSHAIEGAEDDAGAGAAAADAEALGSADVLVGVSASGRTPYTVGAVERARRSGALTVGIANNAGTPLIAAAEHPVLIDTGAESIAGSTRMKAGTAQKAALTLFSTLVMIRLGRVHDGLMVDMVANNAKLRARALAMLSEIAGADGASAQAALDAAGGHVKLAVLISRGLAPEAAQALLDEHGGDLRHALAALGK